jgi:hypothetical protein
MTAATPQLLGQVEPLRDVEELLAYGVHDARTSASLRLLGVAFVVGRLVLSLVGNVI